MMSGKVKKKLLANILPVVFLFFILLSLLPGCKADNNNDKEYVGDWVELSDFEGVPRSDAVAFTIGSKAYVGTGFDGSDRLKDFWEYDPARNQWTRKADFPGIARNGASGFGTSTKGYIGLGFDGVNKLKDFYEYDPATDKWTQVADFAGTARYAAVSFTINDKGYVGTGYDGNSLKDFWQYDPSTNQWTQKLSLAGGKRRDAAAFVIDGKAYVGTGIDNGVYNSDFWEYDPAADQWTKKRSITNISSEDYDNNYNSISGTNKTAFSINGLGYYATGGSGSAGGEVWEYNPLSDLWTQKTGLEATERTEAVGFAIGAMGYVTTGRSSSYYFDDLWGFKPEAKQVDLNKILIVHNNSRKNNLAFQSPLKK